MAVSPTPRPAPSNRFEQALALFSPGLPLAVGLSGGADSSALLLACAQKWPGQVQAVHVHHGLQAAADDFERYCRALCARLEVPLRVLHVAARHAPGESPEDAARRARYKSIDKAFEPVALLEHGAAAIKDIAIGHHADDQVETLLLALSRGAGLPGLSAMPARWQRGHLQYHRPLLGVPADDIRAWLRARGETWVQDPSNADERFTRNRIRARLLPALDAAFPQFRTTFARSAAHAAQGQELLLELAAQDLQRIGMPPAIRALQQISRARQANVLRHWLLSQFGQTPSAAQLAELLDQILACTTRGHQIKIKLGQGWVERRAQVLHWYNPQVLL